MFSIGWNELAILMTVVTFILVWVIVIVSIVARQSRGQAAAAGPVATMPPNVPPQFAGQDMSYLVARITQRFCPRCRAPLAPDAPEGLCPTCLLAGGLASAALHPIVSGMAATTPPNGALASPGEWADLAQRLPQFEILELLGRGGMGSVYRARQKNLDRIVALKVIPPEATKDPAFAERFAREARALARLNHPNIVTVYDFGQVGDLYYLLMECVDGVNLRHALHASRLAPREALAIVPQICDALQYAHDQGVVHRDIKPENVLLDRSGRVKIADFGLAKLLGKGLDDFKLTHTQQVMGTPRYMAPEQIEKPATVDHRADIYSLGVVLYEMLTGELPLGRFDPPSHKVEIDVRIDQVVLRTLEKSPDRRYQRASEVKTGLASFTNWTPPAATAWQSPPLPAKPHAPGRAASAGFMGGCAAAAVVIGLVLLVCAGLLALLLVRAVQPVRESARRAQSMNNLKQIGLALHNYHDTYGSFPPAVVNDADGKPLYSGRVLLLPFIEQQPLYQRFDLTQAWNSPQNQWISQESLPIFMDPSSPQRQNGQTDYLFVTGPKAIFEPGQATKVVEVLDGLSNTMMVVETSGSGIHWAEPRDLPISGPVPLPTGSHPGGNLVLFADGSVHFLKTLSPADVHAITTRDGLEPPIKN